MYYIYPAVFTPDQECGYLVSVPDLPGCVTSGGTLEEAMHMIKDVLCICLCVYEDEKIQILPPRSIKELATDDPTAFATLIEADTIRYRMETDGRAVRTNVSLPAWLKFKAEQAGINFSQILQDGIKQKLDIGQ